LFYGFEPDQEIVLFLDLPLQFNGLEKHAVSLKDGTPSALIKGPRFDGFDDFPDLSTHGP
jgi:hypothetical protein